jgi:hypothetical protein
MEQARAVVEEMEDVEVLLPKVEQDTPQVFLFGRRPEEQDNAEAFLFGRQPEKRYQEQRRYAEVEVWLQRSQCSICNCCNGMNCHFQRCLSKELNIPSN